MKQFDTTGRRLPPPKAHYEAPEPWTFADQKQLLQFLKTPSGTSGMHVFNMKSRGGRATANSALEQE